MAFTWLGKLPLFPVNVKNGIFSFLVVIQEVVSGKFRSSLDLSQSVQIQRRIHVLAYFPEWTGYQIFQGVEFQS